MILARAGVLFAMLDSRVRFSPAALRRIGLATVGVFVVTLVVLSAIIRPWHVAQTSWHSFKYSQEPTGAESHFGGLGSNRYDFWRVGLIEFRQHPVQGIGVDNFLVPYLEQRRSTEEPAYPHSLLHPSALAKRVWSALPSSRRSWPSRWRSSSGFRRAASANWPGSSPPVRPSGYSTVSSTGSGRCLS